MLAFALVSGSVVWWQVVEAQALATRADNPEVIAARRSLLRGSIFDSSGQLLASSALVNGLSARTYADPAFTHVIGYSSLRFGTTGLERAFEDLLVGQADPNPLRQIMSDILDRQPEPRDLTLTIDRRLQDFAAAELGADAGAVVAIDPQTGAILAMVSTPTFDANAISGDPDAAQGPMDALRNDPAEPLLARARQGLYVPGSIMKVFTAAAALDAGVITPDTTYEDQPRQETEGFVVDGFTIREHDLGGIQPGLWPLSESLQVSSNIFFAHVGLELGAEGFLDAARRFGFCAPSTIGPDDRALNVSRELRHGAGGGRLRAVQRRRRAGHRVVRAGLDRRHAGPDGAARRRRRRRRRHAASLRRERHPRPPGGRRAQRRRCSSAWGRAGERG